MPNLKLGGITALSESGGVVTLPAEVIGGTGLTTTSVNAANITAGVLPADVTGGSGLYGASDVTTFARYSDFNGHGSTDTKIMKWSDFDIPATNSTVVTVSQSAANGLTVTANMNCFLFIHVSTDWASAAYFGFSKNSNQLTTGITSITHAHVMMYNYTTAIHVNNEASWSGPMASGDIVRPHSSGTAAGGNPTRSYISVFAIKKQ